MSWLVHVLLFFMAARVVLASRLVVAAPSCARLLVALLDLHEHFTMPCPLTAEVPRIISRRETLRE